ncbi:MAG: ATP-dependent helicase [Planctomycetes bacterium]|nr:ATP-dependent helicase [Planctomycetota bacterium]
METQQNCNPTKWLDGLNPDQCRAAKHCAGPLLVVAGTGKTKTIAARVANLIEEGADPARILLLTFTRRAAEEMLRRAGRVVGEAVTRQVQGGTFHAMAHKLLRIYSEALGLGKNFVVIDPGDAQDLLDLIRTELGLHKSESRFPKKATLLSIYTRCVNASQPLNQALAERFPSCLPHADDIKRIFQEFASRKADRDLLDFDDLLLYWSQALDLPEIGKAIATRFQHILVDEYQDTNPSQAAILQKMYQLMTQGLEGTSCSVMVVGDDAQSIYSFRGATVQNILDFPEQFAGATVITLEQNYRSTIPILRVANAVMHFARKRYPKNLRSDRASECRPELVTCANEMAQSTFIADRILENREEGIPLTKQAVLFRASHNSDALEVELRRRNIPFVKWGGLKFLEAAHIKDLLAFLRVLENPRDDLSWMRILRMFDGIGPGRAREAVLHLQECWGGFQSLEAWNAPVSAHAQLRQLIDLLEGLADSGLPVSVEIERIRQFCTPLFEERYESSEMRLRDLDQMELLSQQARSRTSFLADLTLDPPNSTGDLAGPPLLDEEYVVLSTIHSAKGCEWDAVYVIHVADGVIPSDMAQGEDDLEEERRLLYVALTRARNRLYVTFPWRYFHRKHSMGDAYSTAQFSRFLPPAVHFLFDQISSCPTESDGMPKLAMSQPISANVRARVRQLWG